MLRYGGVVEAGYRLFDLMLARLVELAGGEATVVLVSDHGYAASPVRPTARPPCGLTADAGSSSTAGPGLRRDELIRGAGRSTSRRRSLPSSPSRSGRTWTAGPSWPPGSSRRASHRSRAGMTGLHHPEPGVANPARPRRHPGRAPIPGIRRRPARLAPLLVKGSRSTEAFHLAMVHLDDRRPMLAIPAPEEPP